MVNKRLFMIVMYVICRLGYQYLGEIWKNSTFLQVSFFSSPKQFKYHHFHDYRGVISQKLWVFFCACICLLISSININWDGQKFLCDLKILFCSAFQKMHILWDFNAQCEICHLWIEEIEYCILPLLSICSTSKKVFHAVKLFLDLSIDILAICCGQESVRSGHFLEETW